MDKTNKFARVLVALVMAGLMMGLGYGVSRAVRACDPAPCAAAKGIDRPIMVPGNFTELAENVRDGVVNIQTTKTLKSGGRVFRQFFSGPFGEQNPFEDFFRLEARWGRAYGRLPTEEFGFRVHYRS